MDFVRQAIIWILIIVLVIGSVHLLRDVPVWATDLAAIAAVIAFVRSRDERKG